MVILQTDVSNAENRMGGPARSSTRLPHLQFSVPVYFINAKVCLFVFVHNFQIKQNIRYSILNEDGLFSKLPVLKKMMQCCIEL